MNHSPYTVGYCTNVHAGVDLPSIRDNLDRYAVPIRDSVADGGELGVGLWLPAKAASQLTGQPKTLEFANFLRDRRLHAYTINGFPFDNFHQPVVKRRVYQPAWWDSQRLEYTRQLAEILAVLLPDSESVGSISTLPIGWPSDLENDRQLEQAAENLRQLASHLEQLELRTGRRIVVAIEPEPGCLLDSTDDVIDWFERHLPEKQHRNYLTVCHDICHSAVMMEPQSEAIGRLAEAGIAIGKVQVSSAIVVDWKSMEEPQKKAAVEQLGDFAEDRYLHQTGRRSRGGEFDLAEDLPELLAEIASGDAPLGGDDRWVIHFHVPIFLERFGNLTTSRPDVLECLRTLAGGNASEDGDPSPCPPPTFTGHLEIETYAWTVLPASMRQRGLAEDVAREFKWLRQTIESLG